MVLCFLGVTSLLSLALFTVTPEPSFAGSTCPTARPATLWAKDKVAGRGMGCVGTRGKDVLSVWSRNRHGIKTRLATCTWASSDLSVARLRCRSHAICRSASTYRSKIVYVNSAKRVPDKSRWRHLC
jgi:hypothetical protein